ncbi:MAG TPA: adenylate/guanylate cyclase domain-containing protein [Streptosporangiaceae bacterium]|nr:adenylate/guanylate cyclase domain-containing protein [Streptosporangiaceae bacterium]
METLTFLVTDIEGSTILLRRLGGDAYAEALADHHELIRGALTEHDGTELTMMGDGFLAAFSSPRACVAAALAMQQALEAHTWPSSERVRVRMGIHTGEAELTAAGPVGLDVHRAARIAAVAYGGQILLSETTAALVRGSLPTDVTLRDLGVHRLKDLGRPERIFQLMAPGLRSDFPPLRSLGNPTLLNNLPAELSSFIGRHSELRDIRALVESSRLVTLTGAGGSGKTRLGLQVAADLLDGAGDGVWLVELAAVTDPDAVPAAIAAVLGVVSQPGRSALDTLADALAPQHPLIVLDNCEHLIDGCASTAAAILRRCPKVHLLVTSREPLGIGGEAIYRVPPMSLPPADDDRTGWAGSDAVALFVDRARRQGVDLAADEGTGPLIVSVCRRLDGMPLAIELASARLSSVSLADLRDRLNQRFRLLTGGSRVALARQQTLLATVSWSYSLLDGAEQRLLRRLAVFPESFDLAAAEAACGFGSIERLDVVELLGSLVNKSLVGTEPSASGLRYRLLETIRQFAADRLVEAGDAETVAVSSAHCAHFVALAETAEQHLSGPEQGSWFSRLDGERANLWRAAEWAASAPGDTGQVLRLAAALRRFWTSRSGGTAILELLGPVLARPDARSDLSLFVGAATTVADATRTVSVPDGLRFGAELIELARQVGEPRLLVDALGTYCGLCYFAGEPELGLPSGAEAVEVARRAQDDVLLGASLVGYLMCLDLTDPSAAAGLYAEGIACTQRSGDRLMEYLLHNNASVRAIRDGDFAAARAHLQRAAEASAEIGEQNHVVPVNLGWVLRHEHNPEAARDMFSAALRTSRRIGDMLGLAYCSLGLACTAGDLSDWRRAAELHGVAQAWHGRVGGRWQEPEGQYRQQSIEVAREHLGAARFDEAYARGTTLSFDDAMDLALDAASQADRRHVA